MGFLGSSAYGVYAALGLAATALIAQLVKRPYTNNIRPAINCIFIVCIIGLYTISKLFQDSDSTSIYTSYAPLMLIAILLLASSAWLLILSPNAERIRK